jgi:pimeloyl-ACP methyl ester carboxylesterase
MKNSLINRWTWPLWIRLIRTCGLPFQLYPVKLPPNEARRIQAAAAEYDTVIIFNPGGWGDAPLDRAVDFATILEGIQQNLVRLGNRPVVIPYQRIGPGLPGKIAGIKEQLNSFQNTFKAQVRDIEYLLQCFPEKKIILVGFSVGGGLSGRTLSNITDHANFYAITVGVPGWYRAFGSARSLVLNNADQDPVAVGDVEVLAGCIFKCPANWLQNKFNRRGVSLALSLQFPHHDYSWSSPYVGTPIVDFLEKYFKKPPLRGN